MSLLKQPRMSNFQKVVDFNTQFGVLEESSPFVSKTTIFDDDPATVKNALALIQEEFDELKDAIDEKDFVETSDALIDMVYVILGMSARLGINFDEIFGLVHANNMSKLCKTEEIAKETVLHYKSDSRYDSVNWRIAPDNVHYVVYNKSTNKVLKSITWKPVDLRGALGV